MCLLPLLQDQGSHPWYFFINFCHFSYYLGKKGGCGAVNRLLIGQSWQTDLCTALLLKMWANIGPRYTQRMDFIYGNCNQWQAGRLSWVVENLFS